MLKLFASVLLFVSTTVCHPMVDHSSEGWLQGDLKRSKRKSDFAPMLNIQYVHLNETSGFLECKIGGFPSPSVHWKKDGERVAHSELHYSGIRVPLGINILKSRLYLDEVASDTPGKYTCVGENDHILRKKDINVTTAVEGGMGKGPRIKVWTTSAMETQGSYVRLFCRPEGRPKPKVSWFDPDGERITAGKKYKIGKSGDLVIKDLAWEDMGTYTCQAENANGSGAVTSFVYPLAP